MVRVLFLACVFLCAFSTDLLVACLFTGEESGIYALATIDTLVFGFYAAALSRCVR